MCAPEDGENDAEHAVGFRQNAVMQTQHLMF
jgi:hypothetical protein